METVKDAGNLPPLGVILGAAMLASARVPPIRMPIGAPRRMLPSTATPCCASSAVSWSMADCGRSFGMVKAVAKAPAPDAELNGAPLTRVLPNSRSGPSPSALADAWPVVIAS